MVVRRAVILALYSLLGVCGFRWGQMVWTHVANGAGPLSQHGPGLSVGRLSNRCLRFPGGIRRATGVQAPRLQEYRPWRFRCNNIWSRVLCVVLVLRVVVCL